MYFDMLLDVLRGWWLCCARQHERMRRIFYACVNVRSARDVILLNVQYQCTLHVFHLYHVILHELTARDISTVVIVARPSSSGLLQCAVLKLW